MNANYINAIRYGAPLSTRFESRMKWELEQLKLFGLMRSHQFHTPVSNTIIDHKAYGRARRGNSWGVICHPYPHFKYEDLKGLTVYGFNLLSPYRAGRTATLMVCNYDAGTVDGWTRIDSQEELVAVLGGLQLVALKGVAV